MKKIEYTCNTCRCVMHPEKLKCFYFKVDVIPQRYMIVDNLNLSDVHICLSCINDIKRYK